MVTVDPFDLSSFGSADRREVAFCTESRQVTYEQLASHLAPLSKLVQNRRLVALVARPTLDSIEWLHACLLEHTPVLLLHPRFSFRQQEALAIRAGADLWIDDQPRSLPETHAAHALEADDQILVPTSGSSGDPKIVVLTRAALAAAVYASAQNLPLEPGDCWGLSLPFAHVGGLSVLLRAFAARASVGLPASSGGAEPLSSAFRISHFSLVPTQLSRLLAAETQPRRQDLKRILLGGAATSADLRRRAREADFPIVCTYGMTEMASQVCTQDGRILRPVTTEEVDSGSPLPGVELRLAPNGEIHVRGPQIARAYLNEDTPLCDANGFYPTGDLGRFDADGRLVVLGRQDHMLISGGENVYPEAIEAALLCVAGVGSACAFGVPDEHWGDRIEAVVEMSAHSIDPTALEPVLLSELCDRLPAFAVPRRLWFRDGLPLLPSGKIDRRAVQAEFSAKLPRDRAH